LKILLIRLRLIGDVVFTTPAVRALRRRFPDATLTYLVEPQAEAVIAGNPHLSDVIVAPRARGVERLAVDARLARDLRRRRFDVVVDLHGGPRSAWLTLASGAPVRIGYRVIGRTWIYTHAVDRPRALRPRHSVLNQLDLLSALDPALARATPEDDPVEVAADPARASRLRSRLAARGWRESDPLIVIHVSAGNPFRRWPESSFAELVVRVASADPARRVLLTSGPSDREAARRIGDAAQARLPAVSAASVVFDEDLDLVDLRVLLDRAALFIGGDSGPLHVAAATSVPVVGLYGPTLPARSAPWRPARFLSQAVEVEGLPCRPCNQRRCEPGDFRCLTSLPAEAVAAAAERALAMFARPECEGNGRIREARPAPAKPGLEKCSW
jgi:lipopolysaccharide heptosyltransferase II